MKGNSNYTRLFIISFVSALILAVITYIVERIFVCEIIWLRVSTAILLFIAVISRAYSKKVTPGEKYFEDKTKEYKEIQNEDENNKQDEDN